MSQTFLQGWDKQGSEKRAQVIAGGKDGLEGQRTKVAVGMLIAGVCAGGGHRGSAGQLRSGRVRPLSKAEAENKHRCDRATILAHRSGHECTSPLCPPGGMKKNYLIVNISKNLQ